MPRADAHILGLFAVFERIETQGALSGPIPAAFGCDGFLCRYDSHSVHWRGPGNGDIGIVTILHGRMHQLDRFREDFGA